MHASTTDRQSPTIDASRVIQERPYKFFGCIHKSVEVATVLELHSVGDRDENLDRRASGACPCSSKPGPYPADAQLDGGKRDCYAKRQIIVSMNADLSFRAQRAPDNGDALGRGRDRQRPRAIGDGHALRAVSLDEPGLLRQACGRVQVGHRQAAGDIQTEVSRSADILGSQVGLIAVGGDSYGVNARRRRLLKVVNCADPGYQERPEPSGLYCRGRRLNQKAIGMATEAICE